MGCSRRMSTNLSPAEPRSTGRVTSWPSGIFSSAVPASRGESGTGVLPLCSGMEWATPGILRFPLGGLLAPLRSLIGARCASVEGFAPVAKETSGGNERGSCCTLDTKSRDVCGARVQQGVCKARKLLFSQRVGVSFLACQPGQNSLTNIISIHYYVFSNTSMDESARVMVP